MQVEQGQCFGLASTAHVIWDLLEQPFTFDRSCAALHKRHHGAPEGTEGIAADTRRFVKLLAAESQVKLA